jgi:hypothetical protein
MRYDVKSVDTFLGAHEGNGLGKELEVTVIGYGRPTTVDGDVALQEFDGDDVCNAVEVGSQVLLLHPGAGAQFAEVLMACVIALDFDGGYGKEKSWVCFDEG